MTFFKAEISDILRLNQRDEAFVHELCDYLSDVLKLLLGRRYLSLRQYVYMGANAWYYLLTSVSNLQTLGEEYTGTVRVNRSNEMASTLTQVVWIVFYVGGDKVYDKFLIYLGKKIHFSKSLTQEAKAVFLHIIDFLKENKYLILRLHQSVFYMNGVYHNLSNRLAGVKYILLREWMQDANAKTGFNFLGKVSLLYLLYILKEQAITKHALIAPSVVSAENTSTKQCVLCVENCKNISCTPCGHLFCWDCIHDSLRYQSSCPICREDVSATRVVLLQNY